MQLLELATREIDPPDNRPAPSLGEFAAQCIGKPAGKGLRVVAAVAVFLDKLNNEYFDLHDVSRSIRGASIHGHRPDRQAS